MALERLVDPIAERLLALRTVSGTQWLLRGTGALGMGAALLLALPGGLFTNIGASTVTLVVAAVVTLQAARPDTDAGVIAPVAVVLVLATQSDLTAARALGTGLLLLLSHVGFALAAVLPARGVHEASAWRLTGVPLLAVLALTALGALVVLLLSGVQLGPWTVAAGVLAVIALVAVVVPRPR